VPSAAVQAVVDFFGRSISAENMTETGRGFIECLIGGPLSERRELAAKASPVTYISSGDAPVLVFQGAKDPLVLPSQAIELMEKLSAAGVSGRVEFLLGAGHGWQGEEWDRTWKETIEFFDANLKRR
jgi:dipeptidyl aminopeptidase/acylaminoacyl peptidase